MCNQVVRLKDVQETPVAVLTVLDVKTSFHPEWGVKPGLAGTGPFQGRGPAGTRFGASTVSPLDREAPIPCRESAPHGDVVLYFGHASLLKSQGKTF